MSEGRFALALVVVFIVGTLGVIWMLAYVLPRILIQ